MSAVEFLPVRGVTQCAKIRARADEYKVVRDGDVVAELHRDDLSGWIVYLIDPATGDVTADFEAPSLRAARKAVAELLP